VTADAKKPITHRRRRAIVFRQRTRGRTARRFGA